MKRFASIIILALTALILTTLTAPPATPTPTITSEGFVSLALAERLEPSKNLQEFLEHAGITDFTASDVHWRWSGLEDPGNLIEVMIQVGRFQYWGTSRITDTRFLSDAATQALEEALNSADSSFRVLRKGERFVHSNHDLDDEALSMIEEAIPAAGGTIQVEQKGYPCRRLEVTTFWNGAVRGTGSCPLDRPLHEALRYALAQAYRK